MSATRRMCGLVALGFLLAFAVVCGRRLFLRGAHQGTARMPGVTARGTVVVTVRAEDVQGGAAKFSRTVADGRDVRLVGLSGRDVALLEVTPAGHDRVCAAARRQEGVTIAVRPPDAARFRPVVPGEVTVLPLETADLPLLERLIASAGGTVRGRGGIRRHPSVRACVNAAALARLLERPEVLWIENWKAPRLMNDVAAAVVGVCAVRDAVLPGLTGAGQYITTSDSGIDTGNPATLHPDLRGGLVGLGRVDSVCPMGDRFNHGTHTAGTLIGDGTMSSGRIRGMAPGAKLWAWCCFDANGWMHAPERIEDLFLPSLLTQGVPHIHNASWGTEDFSYKQTSLEYDRFCWEHQDFLPVFSAGNKGAQNTICAEAQAKNVLAVGACENARGGSIGGWLAACPSRRAAFSSCGPSSDGRIKPDLVAPGSGILSTRVVTDVYDNVVSNYYVYNHGTSMATPVVAGAAALVRQWLVENRGFSNPSAALLKAVLTGGAVDMSREAKTNVSSPVPNAQAGWGRLDVGASVGLTNGVYVADHLPYAEDVILSYGIVTTNASALAVQLVWIDYPSLPYVDPQTSQLVNDLDLEVVGANGRWLGNGGAAFDRLNNVEGVRIASAPAGTYEVRVSTARLLESGGAAALYIRGAFDPAQVKCARGAVVSAFTVSRQDSLR